MNSTIERKYPIDTPNDIFEIEVRHFPQHLFLGENELTEEQQQSAKKLTFVRDIFLKEVDRESDSNGLKFTGIRYTKEGNEINLISNDFSEYGSKTKGDYIAIKLYEGEGKSDTERMYELSDSRNITSVLIAETDIQEIVHTVADKRRGL